MVDQKSIADDLECRRNRARLVDFADGLLGEPEKAPLEQHLRGCSDCADVLAALRELPLILRESEEVSRSENFWKEQRNDIMERIQQHEVAASTRRPALFWSAAGLAAALVLAVVGYQTFRERELPLSPLSAGLEMLDEESVAELNDLMDIYVPDSPFVSMDVAFERERGGEVSAGADAESGDGELRRFSEEELESLHHLLGEFG